MAENLPGDLSKVTDIGTSKAIEPSETPMQPSGSFESFMKGGAPTPTMGQPGQISPLDLAAQANIQQGPPTFETLLSQMNSTSNVLGDVQNQLYNKDLKLKQSQKYLLRNKLGDSNEQLRDAATKTGAEVSAPPQLVSRQNPIVKFLSLVSDSQTQIEGAKTQINGLKSAGKTLNPGDLLLVQIKLAKAQQELEYSSVLLSKATGAVSTLMNIQI